MKAKTYEFIEQIENPLIRARLRRQVADMRVAARKMKAPLVSSAYRRPADQAELERKHALPAEVSIYARPDESLRRLREERRDDGPGHA